MFIAANIRRPATASRVFELARYIYYQVHGSRVFSDLVTIMSSQEKVHSHL